jgi:hypothetical protein
MNLLAEKKSILSDWKMEKGSAVSTIDDVELEDTDENSDPHARSLQEVDKEMERAEVKERLARWKMEKEEEKKLQSVSILKLVTGLT